MDMVNLPFLVDSSPQRFWGTAPQDVGSHWGSPTYQQHTSLHRGYHWPYTTSSRGWRGWGAGCHFRWRGLHLKRHMGCCWKFVLIKIDLQWLWFIHDYMTCNIYYLYHIYIYIIIYEYISDLHEIKQNDFRLTRNDCMPYRCLPNPTKWQGTLFGNSLSEKYTFRLHLIY